MAEYIEPTLSNADARAITALFRDMKDLRPLSGLGYSDSVRASCLDMLCEGPGDYVRRLAFLQGIIWHKFNTTGDPEVRHVAHSMDLTVRKLRHLLEDGEYEEIGRFVTKAREMLTDAMGDHKVPA